jgi:hypothetical protein
MKIFRCGHHGDTESWPGNPSGLNRDMWSTLSMAAVLIEAADGRNRYGRAWRAS